MIMSAGPAKQSVLVAKIRVDLAHLWEGEMVKVGVSNDITVNVNLERR